MTASSKNWPVGKKKLILLVLLTVLAINTGCNAGQQIQKGAKNAVCLLTADVNCIRNMYEDDGNQSSVQTEGPSLTEQKTENGLTEPEIISSEVTRGSETVLSIKTNNKGDEAGITATNIVLNFRLYNQFQVKKVKSLYIDQRSKSDQAQVKQIKENGYRCSETESEGNYSQLKCEKKLVLPVVWERRENLPVLEPGEPWQKKYYIDTSQLEVKQSDAYQQACGGQDCTILTEPPYSFKLNGTLSYDFRTSGILPYRVYSQDYWRGHREEVEKELRDYCSGGKQPISNGEVTKTPIKLDAYVLGCELFEGDKAKIFLRAATKQQADSFELKRKGGRDPIESGNRNCARQTSSWNYQKGEEARWQCSRVVNDITDEGETLHFSFELPYRLQKSFEKSKVVRILPRN